MLKIGQFLDRDRITFGQTEMRHPIKNGTLDTHFRPLLGDQAGRQMIAKDDFETKDRGFCQRTAMIPAVSFPLGRSEERRVGKECRL